MIKLLTSRTWGTQDVRGMMQGSPNVWWWTNGTNHYLTAVVPGMPITLNGGTALYRTGFLFNSQDYFIWGSYFLFNHPIEGWVITPSLGYGTMEYQDDAGDWQGDTWWAGSAITGTFVPRGCNKTARSDVVSVEVEPPGWKTTTLYGTYAPQGGVTGTKYVGWRRYDYTIGARTSIATEQVAIYNTYPTYKISTSAYLWRFSTSWYISPRSGSS